MIKLIKHKFNLVILLLLVSVTSGIGQKKKAKLDDLGRIVINAYIPRETQNIPSSAKKMISNKLNQIVTKNGMGGSSLRPRFIITPSIDVLTKDLTATAPPMTALTLAVTLTIGDGIEGTKFATTSVEVKGVGTNETKAYISALKRISPKNPEILSFVEEGKSKIIQYYNSKCDFIIKEAKMLASKHDYEEAILKLTSIPEVCEECFDKAMTEVAPIYKKQIDKDGEIKFNLAKNTWNAGQDLAAGEESAFYLSLIEPESMAYDKAKTLSSTIAKRIKALDQREWDFKMKEYDNTVSVEKSRIEAAKAIGVAYGNNQPKEVTYVSLH